MTTHGTWQPRALKKREGEFNVSKTPALDAAATAAAAAAATVAAAGSSSNQGSAATEWKGEADLDELEEEKAPAAKKPRPDDGADTAAQDPAPEKKKGDEIVDASPRLAAHILSNSKFNKVAAMAYALLESGRVTNANASSFFVVLEAGMRDATRLRDKTYRVAIRKLYKAAVLRTSLFPSACAPTLRRWEVQVLAQADLFTDDTYQFNAAAKQVRTALETLPCIYPALEPAGGATHLAEAERGVWADTLFDCVGSAMENFKYPWAKTTCDMLVKAMVDRRQNFSQAQQAEMQEWNAKCKGQKVMRQQARAARLACAARPVHTAHACAHMCSCCLHAAPRR